MQALESLQHECAALRQRLYSAHEELHQAAEQLELTHTQLEVAQDTVSSLRSRATDAEACVADHSLKLQMLSLHECEQSAAHDATVHQLQVWITFSYAVIVILYEWSSCSVLRMRTNASVEICLDKLDTYLATY